MHLRSSSITSAPQPGLQRPLVADTEHCTRPQALQSKGGGKLEAAEQMRERRVHVQVTICPVTNPALANLCRASSHAHLTHISQTPSTRSDARLILNQTLEERQPFQDVAAVLLNLSFILLTTIAFIIILLIILPCSGVGPLVFVYSMGVQPLGVA
ncbi:hypothetical protein NQZ68_000991 [Dissostichus eleginoides]|nr:hypothetical protein NQZ68_000991 [Dissostichus eleginoides]